MQRTSVKRAREVESIGKQAIVEGWIRTRRDSKGGFSFLELNDGSCLANIQVIADAELENYESDIRRLTAGCSVTVSGQIKASGGRGQTTELHASEVEVHGWADPEAYPLQKKRHSLEKLREWAHLRPRTNTIGAVMRVRNRICRSIHDFFQEDDFLYVHTPIITASDCEGAGEMFRVTTIDPARVPNTPAGGVDYGQDFFDRPTYLTVSGQLEGEIYATALGKIYTFGPTFRAENSNTARHLAEFWMVEPEVAFNRLPQNMELAEQFLKRIAADVLGDCAEDLQFFQDRIDDTVLTTLRNLAEKPFHRISYTEAIDLLQQSSEKFEFAVDWGADLHAEHERFLTEKHFRAPVILHDYPAAIKPFYMKVNDETVCDRGATVRAMDVLVPRVGEIIGGSEREDRLEVLTARMAEQGLNADDYRWYVDLRRFGTVPHSGFGLGLERMVQFVTGMTNIRDVIPFPRTPGST
ncbi:MAG: asparagine--tRNA ligase [Pirellulales bacterium]|nr:asparagine--tRNA ligase [Pirellulales bacterium]